MGSRQSSSPTTNTQTDQYDNRIVAGDGAFVLGQGASWLDSSTYTDAYSFGLSDSSQRNTTTSLSDSRSSSYSDSSNRSIQDNDDNSTSWVDNSLQLSDSSSRYAYTDGSLQLSDSRQTDNSQASSWYALDSSDRSTTTSDDRSWYSYASDDSNRSVTNVTNSGTDPGLVRLAELQAEFMGAAAGQQSDAVKTIAQLGTEGIRRMGESVTDLYGQAGSNTAQAWSHTLDASQALMARVLDQAGSTSSAAGRLAEVAIGSYQPSENKQADTSLRLGMLAAAAVAALVLVPKLIK